MKKRICIYISILAALGAFPLFADSLSATASAIPDSAISGAYDYTYNFTVSGGSYDQIALGSDDLSPLNLALSVDGSSTTSWSWLGNNTPFNYLLFYGTGSPLNDGDVLDVTLISSFDPETLSFAQAFNSVTGAASNQVTGLLGPNSVPEPTTMGFTLFGLSGLGLLLRKLRS